MAFVLIQHLDPGHKSMLTDILSRETRMPVHEVTDQMTTEPNHVYVIPPNTEMTIHRDVLHLVLRDESHEPRRTIDHFLQSLAEDKGPRAIAVILSGADADGARALKDIKNEGGITFAQDPSLAKFNTMPAAAVTTGLVDYILPADQMARELIRIASGKVPAHSFRAPEPETSTNGDGDLAAIYSFLRLTRGVDFTHYKQTTLKRRIQRRMMVQRARTLKDYIKILRANLTEVATLYDDLLIHVTSFFRDPALFEKLKKKVIPHLLQNRSSKDVLRIWVPGCSTGEEVYSIAICLMESLGDHASKTPIQIFATDISEKVLQKARLGIYGAQLLTHVSPERRRKYFSPVSGGLQIIKEIRRLCVFSKQNVAKDPPFSRLDLISCRNLLIYLDSVLQKKVLSIFDYALKPSGLLLLGKSESLGVYSELFSPWDRTSKVYSKANTSVRSQAFFSTTDYPSESLALSERPGIESADKPNMLKEADQFVLGKCTPAGVIVDGDMNILQLRGKIGQYLELVPGAASFHLFKLAKEGLLLELRSAVLEAKKTNVPVKHAGARVQEDGQSKSVAIEVVPLHQSPANDPHYLILFHDVFASLLPADKPGRAERGQNTNTALRTAVLESSRLKKELGATKDYLQSIINEHEKVNEELKSANEEALSSNEEFQSTNEELETAKEELQATNEETSTLNDDLHNRNVELNLLNNDMVNLMNSVNIPTVILGKDHRIRRLTSAAEKVLNMAPTDIGRSIHDLKLTISEINLKDLIRTVLDKLQPATREVQDLQSHWYLLRVQPYRTLDDIIDGVVLTFSDIQTAKELQATAAEWTADLELRVKLRTEELEKSQSALLQAEKLEAIGRLAGGVAHDFNNLMTGILGMTQDVQEKLGKKSPYHEDLEDVVLAAKKAMGVTKQLLAFGRRQVFDPSILNINQVVGSMDKLLQRLLGEDIELVANLDPSLGNVSIDQGNIEQVILNLALNARDSMPKGGRLTIRTTNVEFDNEDAPTRKVKVIPGSYVALTVSDEGCGMSPETMAHMFEPFFTTKENGKGTGLGLASVYGIIKQSGGDISVESTKAQGSSFHIYLPREKRGVTPENLEQKSETSKRGTETILVAEDETIVRKVVVRALRNEGYTVLHATSGLEALKLSEKYAEPIHLLLTDVIMPGINGRELAERLMTKRPSMLTLYMSGYSQEVIAQRGVLAPGTSFIEKSFTASVICQKVRDVLDATKTVGNGV